MKNNEIPKESDSKKEMFKICEDIKNVQTKDTSIYVSNVKKQIAARVDKKHRLFSCFNSNNIIDFFQTIEKAFIVMTSIFMIPQDDILLSIKLSALYTNYTRSFNDVAKAIIFYIPIKVNMHTYLRILHYNVYYCILIYI